MENPIKIPHVIAILTACLLIAIIFISQTAKQQDSITKLVQPSSQLAAVTPIATLSLSPSTNSVSVGGTFTVNILLNTAGSGTYGVDVNQLHFNPNILQVVDADSVTAGVQIAPGSLMSNTVINNVDNTVGTVQLSQLAAPPSTYNGSGILATIIFRAIAAGTSNVTFNFTLGSGTDSNVAGLGGDLLASVGSGSYTVTALDTTAPVISAISASGITQTGATITWSTTGENSDSQVQYGLTTAYGSQTTRNNTMVNSHTVTLPGTGLPALTANTTYHYQVLSRDAAGNLATSGDNTFITTPAPDITPPTISATTLSVPTTSGVTITWSTLNENSDTQVEYALTSAYTNSISTALKDSPNAIPASTLVASHSVTLSGLSAGTDYHYRVKSRDVAGNLAVSPDNVFTTQKLSDTTAPTTPIGLTATPTSESQIQLSWTASTDPTGVGQNVSGVAGYQVFRNGTLLNTSALVASTAYLDTGLTAGTAYNYQVAAVDGASSANISPKSSSVSATTLLLSLQVQRNIILVPEGALATKMNVTGTIEFLDPSTGAKIYEANITTDTSGKYLLSIPSGLLPIVTLRPKITGYLSRLLTNVDLRNALVVNVTFPTLPAGDFNGDQRINSLDFSYMNSRWNMADPIADIDGNGAVNSLDFSFLSNNWLLAGE